MAETLSTTTMITRLEGMLGTRDLNERETEFVEKLVTMRNAGQVTRLSDGQLSYLTGLHGRHFA